jgi:hypothetical protein
VAGGEQDTTSGIADANQVAGSGSGHDAVVADEELLHAVRGTNLCNDLSDLRVVVATISTNDEGCALGTFGNGVEDGGNEVLGVVGLLENLDLLAEAGAVRKKDVSGLFRCTIEDDECFTYVPGFWSWKGLVSTVLTLMIAMGCVCVREGGCESDGEGL